MAIQANFAARAEVDVLLPPHFESRRNQSPEQRLMIAVLQEALDCVAKYRLATDPRSRRVFYEAKQWFLADESHWPYSFESICGVLDLDSNAVRQRLRVVP